MNNMILYIYIYIYMHLYQRMSCHEENDVSSPVHVHLLTLYLISRILNMSISNAIRSFFVMLNSMRGKLRQQQRQRRQLSNQRLIISNNDYRVYTCLLSKVEIEFGIGYWHCRRQRYAYMYICVCVRMYVCVCVRMYHHMLNSACKQKCWKKSNGFPWQNGHLQTANKRMHHP